MRDPELITARFKRKLEKRDARIASLERKIKELEHIVCTSKIKELEFGLIYKSLDKQIAKAVTDALCNVRMIPVRGIGTTSKILNVKYEDDK
jgi:hypothetical protein